MQKVGDKLKKHFKNALLSDYGILSMLIVVVCLSSWLYMLYIRPIDIKYKYSGMRYQAGNLQSAEPVSIEIKGKYERRWFDKPELFEGQIIIDGEICYAIDGGGNKSNKYAFSKEKMSYIESDNFKGFIYNNQIMKEITISLLKQSYSEETFIFRNGWFISAPSNNRKEAVEISNKLIQKLHKDVLIK
jgi:hypothetical protein